MQANNKHNRNLTLFALATAGAVGLLVLPGQAKAGDDWGVRIGFGRSDHRARPVVVHETARTPLIGHKTTRVWVEPVYEERTICEELPATYATREVPVYDGFGRLAGYRQVRECIAPARTVCRTERVCVREGYFQTVTQRGPLRTHGFTRPTRNVAVDLGFGGPNGHFGVSFESRDRSRDRDRIRQRPLRQIRNAFRR